MADIKLKNGSGTEVTYTGVSSITVPLATSGNSIRYSFSDNLREGQMNRKKNAAKMPIIIVGKSFNNW